MKKTSLNHNADNKTDVPRQLVVPEQVQLSAVSAGSANTTNIGIAHQNLWMHGSYVYCRLPMLLSAGRDIPMERSFIHGNHIRHLNMVLKSRWVHVAKPEYFWADFPFIGN
jgi:hypothetical protein